MVFPSMNLSSMRSFVEQTKTKSLSVFKKRSLQALPPSATTPITRLNIADNIDGLADLSEAFHDPAVLDVHRNTHFHLTINSSQTCIVSSDDTLPLNEAVSTANSSTVTLVSPRTMTLNDLKLVKLLGAGASGQVYMAKDMLTNATLALKVIPKLNKDKREIGALLEEQATLKLLRDSDWLLPLEASWSDSRNFFLAMPLYPTDLDSEMMRVNAMEPARARFYMVELILALKELHGRGIIHGDVKGANILIDREGHLVLADFGLAKNFGRKPSFAEQVYQPYWPFLSDEVVTPSTVYRDPEELTFVTDRQCGSPLQMAPELLLGFYYSFGVDFWAAAVTMFWMITGRPPWYYKDPNDIKALRRMILDDPVVFVTSDRVDDDTQDFLRKMLEKDPHDRLRICDIESHGYFAGIDWEKMGRKEIAPPWAPGSKTTHILLSEVERFIPGCPYDDSASNPYPEFDYQSERVKAGIVEECLGEEDEEQECPVIDARKREIISEVLAQIYDMPVIKRSRCASAPTFPMFSDPHAFSPPAISSDSPAGLDKHGQSSFSLRPPSSMCSGVHFEMCTPPPPTNPPTIESVTYFTGFALQQKKPSPFTRTTSPSFEAIAYSPTQPSSLAPTLGHSGPIISHSPFLERSPSSLDFGTMKRISRLPSLSIPDSPSVESPCPDPLGMQSSPPFPVLKRSPSSMSFSCLVHQPLSIFPNPFLPPPILDCYSVDSSSAEQKRLPHARLPSSMSESQLLSQVCDSSSNPLLAQSKRTSAYEPQSPLCLIPHDSLSNPFLALHERTSVSELIDHDTSSNPFLVPRERINTSKPQLPPSPTTRDFSPNPYPAPFERVVVSGPQSPSRLVIHDSPFTPLTQAGWVGTSKSQPQPPLHSITNDPLLNSPLTQPRQECISESRTPSRLMVHGLSSHPSITRTESIPRSQSPSHLVIHDSPSNHPITQSEHMSGSQLPSRLVIHDSLNHSLTQSQLDTSELQTSSRLAVHDSSSNPPITQPEQVSTSGPQSPSRLVIHDFSQPEQVGISGSQSPSRLAIHDSPLKHFPVQPVYLSISESPTPSRLTIHDPSSNHSVVQPEQVDPSESQSLSHLVTYCLNHPLARPEFARISEPLRQVIQDFPSGISESQISSYLTISGLSSSPPPAEPGRMDTFETRPPSCPIICNFSLNLSLRERESHAEQLLTTPPFSAAIGLAEVTPPCSTQQGHLLVPTPHSHTVFLPSGIKSNALNPPNYKIVENGKGLVFKFKILLSKIRSPKIRPLPGGQRWNLFD